MCIRDSNKREYYTTTVKTAGTSSYNVGDLIAFDGSGQTIVVNAPANTTVTLTANTNTNFTADIIATLNIDTKQERIKTLTKSDVLNITSPNTTVLSSDSIAKSDVYKLHAVYDSGNGSANATLPTLTVTSAAGTLTPGETITGGTSGATGIVAVSYTHLTLPTSDLV